MPRSQGTKKTKAQAQAPPKKPSTDKQVVDGLNPDFHIAMKAMVGTNPLNKK